MFLVEMMRKLSLVEKTVLPLLTLLVEKFLDLTSS